MAAPRTHFSPKVEHRDSAIHGRGVFARAAIARGEVVIVKGGHIMDTATRDRVGRELGPTEVQIADGLFIGPMTAEEREASMMYLNHACTPNVGIRGQILFVAMRDIAAGEELVMDYAMMDDEDWTMACRCGTPDCRGTLTGRDWRRPDLQARYRGWFSAYIADKIAAGGAGDAGA